MRLKNETRKRLRENVCSVIDAGSVLNDERIGFNVRVNEVIANIDMFGLSVVGVIDGEGLGTIVVSGENERQQATNLELSKGLSKPYSFLNSPSECNIFGLGGRESNAVLLLGRPAEGTSSKRP